MHRIIKKFFDLSFAIVILVLALPIIILITAISKFLLGSPIVFKQKRIGLNEKIFTIYKFRTMHLDQSLSEKERISKWGNFLRKLSLDELPQLFNILKGDISLVGPRPLLPEYLPLYTNEQRKRHSVLPGITGWAQINGRNSISWKEKFELDLWYVNNQSIWLDLKIIVLTIFRVLNPKGINSSQNESMPRFNGNN